MFFKEDDTLQKMNSNRILHTKEEPEEHDEEPLFVPLHQKIDREPLKKLLKKLIWLIPAIILAIILYKVLNPHNPLIGKWKTTSKAAFSLGDLEFTKDKIATNGIASKIQYDIQSDKINIMDELGTGIIFYIKDEKTIESNLLGNKTTYKKVQ
ncbi:MAG: hypothetical protein J0647_00925 [Campylobacteraceae bacterium]|nr:hypothetical protein [Campylobacteraceae bacterium]